MVRRKRVDLVINSLEISFGGSVEIFYFLYKHQIYREIDTKKEIETSVAEYSVWILAGKQTPVNISIVPVKNNFRFWYGNENHYFKV